MTREDGSIGVANAAYAERLARRFRADERSVPPSWRDLLREEASSGERAALGGRRRRSVFDAAAGELGDGEALLEVRVERLADAFVREGHRAARIDPLDRPRPAPPELEPAAHGIRVQDLDRTVGYGLGRLVARRPVRWVLRHLRESYCGPLAVEIAHVRDAELRELARERVEARGRPTPDERRALLRLLLDAALFEEFVRKRFVGAKSYSLAGSEALLPLLEAVFDDAAASGLDEIVLAMTHRGRLNVLAHLVGKPMSEIFRELEGRADEPGDLRHHLGASADRERPDGGRLHVSLCFNPSHLEFVGPIAAGRTRAKQDREGDSARTRGMALVVHGDAGFAGEGVVGETFNLSRLEGYATGGTLHVVLDNQLGFTTPPEEGRSSEYATDVAKRLDVPILHANGEDPEAVARAARIGAELRRASGRDVVVELRAYRRFGHNELDEPRFTQPRLYARIDERRGVHERYAARLVDEGVVTEAEVEEIASAARARFERERSREEEPREAPPEPSGVWAGFRGGPASRRGEADTRVDAGRLAELLEAAARVPEGFRPHEKVERVLDERRAMARGEREIDWASAELLALASLAAEGVPVRLSGQDTVRGTFSQRHAALFDRETGERFDPLGRVAPDAAPVEVVNSPLSELGALGFEYGYSLDRPAGLVLWEAQFGDFANAAQVVIDQFLASAEEKWRRLSGLVLLLPHGFEGQGPEHSSARPERFLASAAADNIQVAQPSTPEQHFHLLRRQALSRWRKPLVVLTPKSLLRHRRCVAKLDELAEGAFRPVLAPREGEASRVLLCGGKLAYELEDAREERGRDDVAIVRVEELYPIPAADLRAALERFADGTPVVWVQEEPENMGAWRHLRAHLEEPLFGRFPLRRVSRPASAAPASGSKRAHAADQERLVERAFEE